MDDRIHLARIFLIVLAAALALSGCGPSPSSALTSLIPATPTATPTVLGSAETAALNPTATPVPTDTATETSTPTATSTLTKRAVTVASKLHATPTPTAPPGVFVATIKIDPTPAKSNDFPQFTVTFLNTTGQLQTYRWFVKVYAQDQPQSFGETSKIQSDITPKTSQVRAFSDWKTTVVTDCLFLIARVFWVDQDNQVHEFLKSNASSHATGFNVCP